MQRLVDQGEKFDAVITDPPFHLVSIAKRFGGMTADTPGVVAERIRNRTDSAARLASGFVSTKWDGHVEGEKPIAFDSATWILVRQLLKPGGRLLAFGGTRTMHRMACAIEDAGFEYEDTIVWVFGQGLVLRKSRLKPGQSPICMARAPGPALNLGIDECRTEVEDGEGRWPANLIHDGSSDVIGLFPDAPGQQADASQDAPSSKTSNVYGKLNREGEASAKRRYANKGGTNFMATPGQRRSDSGSAARFFNACPFTEDEMEEIRLIYNRKCTAKDRRGSKHPTLKSISLLRHLVRLVVPKGGSVLDPFAGSGTLGEAALLEGRTATMIEREDDYATDAMMRMVAVEIGV